METTTKARETRRYTVRHPVELSLGVSRGRPGRPVELSLMGITSTDPEEDRLLGEPLGYGYGGVGAGEAGYYLCFDAGVRFVAGGLEIDGADGPSGGSKVRVVLTVPQDLIRSMKFYDV